MCVWLPDGFIQAVSSNPPYADRFRDKSPSGEISAHTGESYTKILPDCARKVKSIKKRSF